MKAEAKPHPYTPRGLLREALLEGLRNQSVGGLSFRQLVATFEALGRLHLYEEGVIQGFLEQTMSCPLHLFSKGDLTALFGSFVELRVHDAPLLNRLVSWYVHSLTNILPEPFDNDGLDKLSQIALQLAALGFNTREFTRLCADALMASALSYPHRVALLNALARFHRFEPPFKDAFIKLKDDYQDNKNLLSDRDMSRLSQVYICTSYDGPPSLRAMLGEEQYRDFMQQVPFDVWFREQEEQLKFNATQEWYQTIERVMAMLPGDYHEWRHEVTEVYGIDFVKPKPPGRENDTSEAREALLVIPPRDHLRWYVPVAGGGAAAPEAGTSPNRCNGTKVVVGNSLLKVKHLHGIWGYNVAALYLAEWNELQTDDERKAYLEQALAKKRMFRPIQPASFTHGPADGI